MDTRHTCEGCYYKVYIRTDSLNSIHALSEDDILEIYELSIT